MQGQCVSSYFVVPESKRCPEKWTPILNLKKLNKYVQQVFLCKEELKVFRKCFQMGLDIKDAFLHTPIRISVKKFLRFAGKGKLNKWQVLLFGLKYSPRY